MLKGLTKGKGITWLGEGCSGKRGSNCEGSPEAVSPTFQELQGHRDKQSEQGGGQGGDQAVGQTPAPLRLLVPSASQVSWLVLRVS